jgi:hypothetical protein
MVSGEGSTPLAREGYQLIELDYELRDDGVLYTRADGTRVKVQGNSPRSVTVSLQKGEVIVPPETGNFGGSKLRNRLASLAGERFGEMNGLVEDLGSIAAMFDEHLRERREAAEEHLHENEIPELAGTRYRISEEGGFVLIKHTREGEVPVHLTNFVARVEEQLVRDDGAEEKRIYKISGRIGDRCLPTIDVPVNQFNSMNWVSEHWGLEAHVSANQNTYAKEVIELYSSNAVKRFRYAHTGWRVLEDGTRVYLHSEGALS